MRFLYSPPYFARNTPAWIPRVIVRVLTSKRFAASRVEIISCMVCPCFRFWWRCHSRHYVAQNVRLCPLFSRRVHAIVKRRGGFVIFHDVRFRPLLDKRKRPRHFCRGRLASCRLVRISREGSFALSAAYLRLRSPFPYTAGLLV